MKPSSFCTLSTYNCHNELFGLLLSLSLHHPNEKIYCVVDTETKKAIESYTPTIKLDIKWLCILDKYSAFNRAQMEANGLWSEFQMQKAVAIHEALKFEKDTLFLDADILVLDKIDDINHEKELGVSPHYIKKSDTDKYGYYNGGVLWTNQKTLKTDWVEFTKTSRFFDQASIEDLERKYDSFEFGENYNFSWWRVFQSNQPPQEIIQNITVINKKIHYKNKPLKFIHTHFHEKNGTIGQFNLFFTNVLKNLQDYRSLLIIDRMIHGKWIVNIPMQPMEGLWSHTNDSFRELLVILRVKNADLELNHSKDIKQLWLFNTVLMYDRPNLTWANQELLQCKKMLLGNGSMEVEGKQLKENGINVGPWIFWPRRPMILESLLKKHQRVRFNERENQSIFIGNYENAVQKQFRDTQINWPEVISEFHCTSGGKHKFTQVEYLHKLRQSKFGLSLRGFGSKCHREVELMAFGTVPLITPSVSIHSYSDPPKENVHYLAVKTAEEAKQKMAAITEEKWEEMSKACYDWYQRNVYSDNCWGNTLNMLFY